MAELVSTRCIIVTIYPPSLYALSPSMPMCHPNDERGHPLDRQVAHDAMIHDASCGRGRFLSVQVQRTCELFSTHTLVCTQLESTNTEEALTQFQMRKVQGNSQYRLPTQA